MISYLYNLFIFSGKSIYIIYYILMLCWTFSIYHYELRQQLFSLWQIFGYASSKFWRPLMTFANNLDPDEAPQNVGPHLRSKLFDTQIIYQLTKLHRNNEFLQILKEMKNRSNSLSAWRVKQALPAKIITKVNSICMIPISCLNNCPLSKISFCHTQQLTCANIYRQKISSLKDKNHT